MSRPQPRHAARRPLPWHNLAIVAALALALGVITSHALTPTPATVTVVGILAAVIAVGYVVTQVKQWRKS